MIHYDKDHIRRAAIRLCPYDLDDCPISASDYCKAFIDGAQWLQQELQPAFENTDAYELAYKVQERTLADIISFLDNDMRHYKDIADCKKQFQLYIEKAFSLSNN